MNLNSDIVEKSIIEHEVLENIIELFFKFEKNNILHF